jgi:hypothetical protein
MLILDVVEGENNKKEQGGRRKGSKRPAQQQ